MRGYGPPTWEGFLTGRAMHLDTLTMSVVNLSVTAVIAAMLLLTWGRDGWTARAGARFVGAWGLAMVVHVLGSLVMLLSALSSNLGLVTVGASVTIAAVALQWHATRDYAGRSQAPAWILLGPAGYLLAAYSGLAQSLDARLILGCAIFAAYSFAAAAELRRIGDTALCWPAITILVLTGMSYISWIPFSLTVPVETLNEALTSAWVPVVALATMLMRIALAFIVLSMAKEREEKEQRREALTDSLTGLPNRRALFEAADAVAARRVLGGTPVSVLIFDLDRFKDTNDSYGHELGDAVLKIFATIVQRDLKVNAIVARLGGEEFAAILPGSGAEMAVAAAERVRLAFARAGAFVGGLAVGATVSVGVASDTDADAELSGLFRRADAALYVAKRGGRDQVAFLEADEGGGLPEATVRTSPARASKSQLPRRPLQTA